jgi:uncharacterized protein (DUF2141 family)
MRQASSPVLRFPVSAGRVSDAHSGVVTASAFRGATDAFHARSEESRRIALVARRVLAHSRAIAITMETTKMKTFSQATAILAATLATAVSAATLEVTIDNVKSEQGMLMLAVYDSAGYRATPLRAIAQAATAPTFRFADLPEGEYAVAVFHDRNGNGKLDMNLLGVPTEAYGFSLHGPAGIGAPAWPEAKFSVPAEGVQLKITLSNGGG